MKKLIILLAFTNLIVAQEKDLKNNVSVEKNIFTIQASPISIFLADEYKLSKETVLHAEFGYKVSSVHFTNYYGDGGYKTVFPAVFNIEPRWYYNLDRRAEKGKKTNNNSANFMAMGISYIPSSLVIHNLDSNYYLYNEFLFAPRYGFKRNFGKSNFNYELSFAAGYYYGYTNKNVYKKNDSDFGFDLKFRFGYNFTKKK